jgi:5-methylcytosine-specific restriction endonuclease McrA
MAENFYRKFLKQKYSDIHKAFKHDDAHPHDCFYCGEPAEDTDHQPPLSRVDSYRGLGVGREFYVTVRCCKECNGLLGDALTVDLRERAELAHEALYRKYEKDLTCKLWNREKIKEADCKGI